ncbi:coiled-coil domain-containing protein 187 [Sardina pilchardus]|uniref:coiled-coil domain-containing protein 187 n=1 Tax=Sardina pilchardus TaxID=27697 RepID=UPI002E12CD2F
MAELEIDQSNLPRVEEVCQSFAVLEDGALAHNLQEQEIEQYYSANVEKNQLVQRDIRIARRLQDEEHHQLQHLSRQREEQDSEYARIVQEELQRCAEEAHRREEEDQEIAKRIQEEEELRARRRGGCHSSASRDGTGPGSSYPTHPDHAWACEHDRPSRHWHPPRDRRSPSLSPSPSPSPPSDSEYGPVRYPHDRYPNDPNDRNPNERYPNDRYPNDPNDQNPNDQYPNDRYANERFPDDRFTDDQFPDDRPARRRSRPSPVVGPAETVAPGAPFSGSWADALRLIKQDMSEQGYASGSSEDELPASPLRRLERVVLSREQEAAAERHPSRQSGCRAGDRGEDGRSGSGHGDERGWRSEPRALRHSASVRHSSASDWRPTRPLERVGSWASSHSSDKHVHFQDDRRRSNGYHRDGRRAYEGSYEGFRENGGAASYNGESRLANGRSRGQQTYPSDYDGNRPQQVPPLQRSAFARRSYHGDARRSHRHSFRDGRGNGYHRNGTGTPAARCIPEERGEEPAEASGPRERSSWDRRSCRSSREHRGRPDYAGQRPAAGREEGDGWRARRWHSERRPAGHWHRGPGGEDGVSSGEEGAWERRADSHTAPSHRSADTGVPVRPKGAPLAMGDLQQVLLDEELARRLQEEEERLLRRSPRQSSPPRRVCAEGDFRVAQEAQDEEIARFMQKQEIKAKRGWMEAEAPGSSPDAHDHCSDRRAARQRQRERLDSQGLPSPPEDYQPDEQSPSPVGVAAQQQPPAMNIAEALDPTFQAKRMENFQVGQPGLGMSEGLPQAQSGCYNATEQPAFVQPTKRPNETKPGRAKAKEKKENAKQKENCKQQ